MLFNCIATKNAIRLLIAIPFIPLYDVNKIYYMVKNWILKNINEDINSLFCYFEKTYIGIFDYTKNYIISELYSKEFWNGYDRIKKNVLRTINVAEAWHRIFNFRNQVAHPNIVQFLNESLNEKKKINII